MEIINELERTLIDHLNFILSLSDECIENSELKIRCEGDEDGQFLSCNWIDVFLPFVRQNC